MFTMVLGEWAGGNTVITASRVGQTPSWSFLSLDWVAKTLQSFCRLRIDDFK